MDEASRSRAHISLYFPPPPLSGQSTVDIFTENLKLIKKPKVNPIRIKEREFENFAKGYYSFIAFGREQGAEEEEAEKRRDKKAPKAVLRPEHFELVELASTRFDDYLNSVLGMTQSDLARQKSVRKDDWESKREKDRDRRGQDNRALANAYRRKTTRRVGTSDSSSDSAENVVPKVDKAMRGAI
ncbi:hypothetical protein DL765_006910 [Monosporascus sp. GIB2]|nr:hypothetical protein DL765_006910 [Monosporascus sp. GIB2]